MRRRMKKKSTGDVTSGIQDTTEGGPQRRAKRRVSRNSLDSVEWVTPQKEKKVLSVQARVTEGLGKKKVRKKSDSRKANPSEFMRGRGEGTEKSRRSLNSAGKSLGEKKWKRRNHLWNDVRIFRIMKRSRAGPVMKVRQSSRGLL